MPIEVLLVEDSPSDALLTSEALAHANQFRLDRCDRLDAALRLLDQGDFNVVLLDLGLPDSQGLETLRKLRDKDGTIAVIILTGNDDEELALHAIQKGADDYVVKNQMDAAQLRRAIRYAVERAQTTERLRQSEERFRLLVEGVEDHAIIMLTPEGNVLTWNSGAERALGYPEEEILGQHYSLFFRVEDLASGLVERELAEAAGNGRALVEGWRVRKDRTQFWANGSLTALYDNAGTVRGYAKITKDLTDRKQVEERLEASERRFRQLADAMPQVVWTARSDGYIDYFNERWYEYTGSSRTMHSDDSWRLVVHPDDLTYTVDSWTKAVLTGRRIQIECRLKEAAGGYRWHLVRGIPVRDESMQVTHWIGTGTDIEDLKQAEQELSDRTEMAELAADVGAAFAAGGSLINILQACVKSLVRHLDAAFARIWTLNEKDNVLELQASAGLYTHLDGPHSRIPVGQFKIGRIAQERLPHLTNSVVGDPQVSDQEWARREGMVAFAGYPLLADGRVLGVVAVFAGHPLADVTLRSMGAVADVLALGIERAQAEQALRSNEELLRGAFDFTNLATGIADLSYRLIRVNEAFSRLFGYSEAEMLNMSIADLTHPDDRAETYTQRDSLLAGTMRSFQMEKRYIRKDGGIIWTLVNVALLRDAHGKPSCYVGQLQDITERKRAEEELRLRDRAIQAVSQGILITDPNQPDNPIIFASPGFERLTGYTAAEAVGRNCRFLQGPKTDREAVTLLREAIQTGHAASVEILNYRKDGSAFWNGVSISPVRDAAGNVTHFVGVQTDVSERRGLEDQLRQAQKLEAIGSLAGGVAHDFNNLLTIINGYGEIIQAQMPADSPAKGLAREIIRAGERAASLTRQLLAFSRKQVLEPKVLSLNGIINDTAKMLKRLIGEDIELATVLNQALGLVKADPGQVEQVLINLVVNARDAMPQGGKLTIETANVALDASYTRIYPDLAPGPYVMMAVSDTGSGMDQATKARIFDPFFTTKGEGKGTGLGLSTVFGIIKQSGGHVAVYSEPGQGATFKVYLPQATEERRAKPAPFGFQAAPSGIETILLVEDEPALLALTSHVLRTQGYTVLEAADGTQALRLAEQQEGAIHLLVSDVVMPSMSGRQVAEGVKAFRPAVKVLFMSGYTNDAVVRHGVLHAETAFIQKPYTPTALALKVREVLDG